MIHITPPTIRVAVKKPKWKLSATKAVGAIMKQPKKMYVDHKNNLKKNFNVLKNMVNTP